MRVLVTGATGFIGRHAAHALVACGADVHAVSRRPPIASGVPAESGIVWHEGDLLRESVRAELIARTKPDALLHCAWYAEHGLFWHSPENIRWLSASLDLCLRFVECGGKRLLVSGTCAEYEWRADTGVYREDSSATHPATLYGVTKLALYQTLAALATETRVSLAWGRLFWLYGPDEHPDRLVAAAARALATGTRFNATEGRQVRDFLHVADAGAALATLLTSDVRGVVNIASGEGVQVRDVVLRLAAAAGRPDLCSFDKPVPAREVPCVTADITRLRDDVGFAPARSLQEGLDETLAWWRGQLRAGTQGRGDRI